MAEIAITNEQAITVQQIVDAEISVDYYGSVEGSDVYFSRFYKRDLWKTTKDADKVKLLYQATQDIDRLNFKGNKTSEKQVLQFPRGGDKTIPITIEYATYEIAYRILQGVDSEEETEKLGIESQQYGSVKTLYKQNNPLPNVTAGIVSSNAWRMLLPYLRRAEELTLVRV